MITLWSNSLSRRILEGICSAVSVAAYTATFIQLYPERVVAISAWCGSASGIGYSVGPVIGGFLYDIGGFYLPFMVIGILAIIFSLITLVALPHREFQKSGRARISGILTNSKTLFKVSVYIAVSVIYLE